MIHGLPAAAQLDGFIVPMLILTASIIALVLAWRGVRRFFFADEGSTSEPSWGLEQLRQLRDRGEINQAEYDRLRQSAIALAAKQIRGKKAGASSGGSGDSGLQFFDSGGIWATSVHDDGGPAHHPAGGKEHDSSYADHSPTDASSDGGGSDGGFDAGGGDSGGGDSGGGGSSDSPQLGERS